jgi:hypothetical protein
LQHRQQDEVELALATVTNGPAGRDIDLDHDACLIFVLPIRW